MPSSFSRSAVALPIIAIVAVTLRSYLRSRRRGKLPPGPRGLPIIGNIHQFTKDLWFTVDNWRKEYGPIVYINAAGQDMVIVGTHKVASELLDRRAGIYSDRQRFIVAGELLTEGLVMSLTPYNESWRRMRRAAHEAMNPQIVKNYFPFQEAEASILVSSLAESPELYKVHLQRTSNSLMISIIYGIPPILDSKDPLIMYIDGVAERILEAAQPGAYLVEFFTWMEYLPRWMCPWRREAEAYFKDTFAKFGELFDGVAARLANGNQMPCLAATLIEQQPLYHLTDMEAAWTAGTLYIAGAETTSGQLLWFLLAMIVHPEVQKRAHEELDRVVGRDRMPTFQDYEHLPYIRALVKETMRWRSTIPLGLPHVALEDDYYEGYFIPKGTVCIPNGWGLNHDVDVYGPDANDFRPERFLGPDGTLGDTLPVDTKEEGHITYGFGRRICVGRYLANNGMFIQMASMLWAYDILPGYDGDGVAIMPDKDVMVDRGIVIQPEPFKCQMRRMFEDVEGIVAATRESRMQIYTTWSS